MRTPISYYGGKQNMSRLIVSLMPPHKLYCEPFCGGAAVLFAKEPSELEVINDHDERVINFYRTCVTDFGGLRLLIEQTPASRAAHRFAGNVLKYPDAYSSLRRAWAFWVQTNMSFGCMLFAGYGYARSATQVKKIANKRDAFRRSLLDRLRHVDMECNSALQVIKSRDAVDTFFYIDPPYYNADMGHYKGYTAKDFEDLLSLLSTIKGKFLLSSYPSDMLFDYTQKHGWYQLRESKPVAVSQRKDVKMKTEVLTANFPI